MRKLRGKLAASSLLAVVIIFSLVTGAHAETWSQVNVGGFGNTQNGATIPLEVFNGDLYAGTWNPVTGGELWRTSNGTTWTPVVTGGLGNAANVGVWPLVFLKAIFMPRAKKIQLQVREFGVRPTARPGLK